MFSQWKELREREELRLLYIDVNLMVQSLNVIIPDYKNLFLHTTGNSSDWELQLLWKSVIEV